MALICGNTFIKIEDVVHDTDNSTCSCVINTYDYNGEVISSLSKSWKGSDLDDVVASLDGRNILSCLYDTIIPDYPDYLWSYDADEDIIYSMPKIYKYVRDGVKSKHFHEIDYTKELIASLHPKRTLVQGELQKVVWHSTSDCNDPILEVVIDYSRDILGFASSRVTTRSWYNFDDTKNSDVKITNKDYTINALDQIDEGITRRGNIVKGLQMPILTYMVGTVEDQTQTEIIQTGRDFLKLHKTEFQSFVEESHKQILTDIEDATDTWLDNVIDTEGTTIRDYILVELDIE